MTDAFWTDPDETERYGNYVRLETFDPWDPPGRPDELAVFAWRRGTGPVMAPPYIWDHHRVLSARLARDDYDGQLIATVDLLTTAPRELRGAPLPGDGHWRDWPSDWSFSGDHTVWHDPYGPEFAGGARYMLGSISLQFPVTCELPAPGPDGADAETCVEAVAELVRHLNEIVGPVIDRIEGN
jgi:hypothetical protein